MTQVASRWGHSAVSAGLNGWMRRPNVLNTVSGIRQRTAKMQFTSIQIVLQTAHCPTCPNRQRLPNVGGVFVVVVRQRVIAG
jgi:hypothetical protein